MSESQKQRAYKFMKGWTTAAGLKEIPKELESNTDFLDGWRAGKESSKEAHKAAEAKYGIKWAIIQLA